MYEFLRGPMVWVAFIIFVLGMVYRLVTMLRMAKKDKVVYPYMSAKYSFRSLLHWVVPFASRNMRLQPEMTILSFVFHICLIITPIFLLAHNILLQQSWGISLWTISENVADVMTLIVIFACVAFLLRRLANPTVRFVTFPSDYVLLFITFAPFFTGFLAAQQLVHYQAMTLLHMLFGELMLIAIPFTRLSHMFFFPFTRAYMGSEFGSVRNARDW
jgi:nitrate reductase gamma subunit